MAQLVGQGSAIGGGATSVIFSSPFPHKPGARHRDSAGNEYLFVDFTGTTYYGCLVQINELNEASPLLGTALKPFRVGVVMGGTPTTDAGNHPTSDNAGWVQIYGVHAAVQTHTASAGAVSDGTAAYWCIPQTSVGTPSGTLSLVLQGAGTSIAQASTDGNVIYGMWLVDMASVSNLADYPGASGASGAATNDVLNSTSGANTSAFSGQTYAAFLNYPYVTGITVALSDATS